MERLNLKFLYFLNRDVGCTVWVHPTLTSEPIKSGQSPVVAPVLVPRGEPREHDPDRDFSKVGMLPTVLKNQRLFRFLGVEEWRSRE